MMKASLAVMAVMMMPVFLLAGYFNTETFEGHATGPFSLSGWVTSGDDVVVTDTEAYAPSTKSVLLPEGGAVTNETVGAGNTNVWTEFRLRPALGVAPAGNPELVSSFVMYVTETGVPMVYADGGWLPCEYDIFGNPVPPVVEGEWVNVAVRQNYTAQTQVIIINDYIVAQGVSFAADEKTSYGSFSVLNLNNNAYLDDVRIQDVGFEAARYAANRNSTLDAMTDAQEIHTYGYAARTLYVGTGGLSVTNYATVQAAVDAWLPRDRISIVAGTYAEAVVIDKGQAVPISVTGVGGLTFNSLNVAAGTTVTIPSALDVTGTMTVAGTATFNGTVAAADVTISGASTFADALVASGTLAVGATGTATFNGTVNAGTLDIDNVATFAVAVTAGAADISGDATFDSTLNVSGALAVSGAASFGGDVVATASLDVSGTAELAANRTMTIGAATVSGELYITSEGDLSTASLAIMGSGFVDVVSGSIDDTDSSVVMSGTFRLTSSWGSATAVAQALPFSEDWELYATNTPVSSLGFRGWGVAGENGSGIVVEDASGVDNSKAVLLPDGSTLANAISAGLASRVWTDYHLRPSRGVAPAVDASLSSFVSFVNEEGYLEVRTAGDAWRQCHTNIAGGAVAQMTNAAFTRVTVFTKYADAFANTFSVFVDNALVLDAEPFPGTSASYSSFNVDNSSGSAYLDNVLITDEFDRISSIDTDLDGDGQPDAIEINMLGSTTVRDLWAGSFFRFL